VAGCPAGHDTAATDYCDECGLPLSAAPAPATPAPVTTCANCGAPRDGRFCEECGHDATAPPAAPPAVPTGTRWAAVVRADRGWFDEVRRRDGPDAADLQFPRYHPELRFDLVGRQLAIGRRSRSRGTDPDIDLSGPQHDPGVSAQHAMLLAGPAGWEIVDLGSTNGTSINDDPSTIPPHTPVPLGDGDRVHVGAWTTITVRSAAR
jgi:FHA domain